MSFKRAVFLLWGLFWALSFQPVQAAPHIVYADPIGPMVASVRPMEPIQMPAVSPQEPVESIFVSKLRPYGTYANSYYPGQCTWYVASRLPVPQSWGNAINWGYAARLAGYTISPIPKPGAIAWSVTDSYLGHVAVVNDDGVSISEMNYQGPYITDERIPNAGEFQYIYF